MKYTATEKADPRVIESSPAPLPFPGKLEALPESAGVIVLTDDLDTVLYVGWGESIRELAETASRTGVSGSAHKFRWFRTADEKAAKVFGKALIRKYKPTGNQDDSQWGVVPVFVVEGN